MKHSASPAHSSCPVEEVFDHPALTHFAGANLLVDFLRERTELRAAAQALPFQKSHWATYSLADEIETLVLSACLGLGRIFHTEVMEHDPLLQVKLGLDKLPHRNTLYRTLDRFSHPSCMLALSKINDALLGPALGELQHAVLDLDTTVETVHGRQEGACVSYNPRYRGRPSYQPLLVFEGQTQACVWVELRSGHTPREAEKISAYHKAKASLPAGCAVRFVRADASFASEGFFAALEADQVGYAVKMRLTPGLMGQLDRVSWRPLPSDPSTEIEAGSLFYQAQDWSRPRRVVFIRTRLRDEQQRALFDEYLWEYQAIVTTLDADPEDVWHFYNQRCTAENFIKQMKGDLHMDAIPKAEFWPNAAALWIKTFAYNLLLLFKRLGPESVRCLSIGRLRRMLLCVPGVLTRHARRLVLRLPAWWPFQGLQVAMRLQLQSG